MKYGNASFCSLIWWVKLFLFCWLAPLSAEPRWDGQLYEETAQLQRVWADRFFFSRQPLKPHQRVLDLGCGDGVLTARVARLVPKGLVVGLDRSASMIDLASTRHRAAENLSFAIADVCDSTVFARMGGCFDVVVSFAMLHWAHDQLAVLNHINYALKEGGHAYLTLASDGHDPQQEAADRIAQSPKWSEHFSTFVDPIHRFSPDEYRLLLESAGLHPVEVVQRDYLDILPNPDALRRQVKSWLPHYRHLPEDLREVFLDEVMETLMVSVEQDENGSLVLSDSWLEVVCRK